MTPIPDASLEVYLLGLVELDDLLGLQRKLVYEFGERPGAALIVCEHPPTISVGRGGSRAHILCDDDELRAWGVRVRWVNRGGGCVLHLPGQIAAYLVMPLQPRSLGLETYLGLLSQIVREVLVEFDLRNQVRTDAWGVRLGEERVATIGVAVRRWIAYHGFTLNVGPFLAPFSVLTEPGGDHAARATSMEARRQRPTPMTKVRESLLRHVESVFALERHALFSTHPLIRQTAFPHVHTYCPI
jgi:lipoyl(octanoyl) transferase